VAGAVRLVRPPSLDHLRVVLLGTGGAEGE